MSAARLAAWRSKLVRYNQCARERACMWGVREAERVSGLPTDCAASFYVRRCGGELMPEPPYLLRTSY